MDLTSLIYFLLIGLVAGYLAALIMKPSGTSMLVNLFVGVIGALLGGFLCQVLNIAVGGLLGSLIVATGGAVLFLFLLKLVKR